MLLQALCIISKPSVYSNWSYSPETLNLGQNWRFFCPVWPWIQTDDPEKQQGTCSMLLRALCIISKPSVNSNWSYSLETLNSGQNWQFVSCVTLKFDGWFKKTIEHLFYATSSFIHHFVTISEFKQWIYSPEMPKLGRNLFWPLTFCMDITFGNGNYPWKFHDDLIAGTLTDKTILRAW